MTFVPAPRTLAEGVFKRKDKFLSEAIDILVRRHKKRSHLRKELKALRDLWNKENFEHEHLLPYCLSSFITVTMRKRADSVRELMNETLPFPRNSK